MKINWLAQELSFKFQIALKTRFSSFFGFSFKCRQLMLHYRFRSWCDSPRRKSYPATLIRDELILFIHLLCARALHCIEWEERREDCATGCQRSHFPINSGKVPYVYAVCFLLCGVKWWLYYYYLLHLLGVFTCHQHKHGVRGNELI